jgi:HD-like signal output (HDOD) protein
MDPAHPQLAVLGDLRPEVPCWRVQGELQGASAVLVAAGPDADAHLRRALREAPDLPRAFVLPLDAGFDARRAQLVTACFQEPTVPSRWRARVDQLTRRRRPIAERAPTADLPSLPETSVRLLTALEQPGTRLVEVAAILEDDPALAASVLALANSAYHGVPRRMASLPAAVVHLGVTTLRLAVLTCQVFAALDVEQGRRLRQRATRRLSIARRLGPITDEAVTATLLLDAGTLLVQALDPDHARRTDELTPLDRTRADEDALGVDRDLLGAALLAHWQLPDRVVDAVALARHPFPSHREGLGATAVAWAAEELLAGRPVDPGWARTMGLQRALGRAGTPSIRAPGTPG